MLLGRESLWCRLILEVWSESTDFSESFDIRGRILLESREDNMEVGGEEIERTD